MPLSIALTESVGCNYSLYVNRLRLYVNPVIWKLDWKTSMMKSRAIGKTYAQLHHLRFKIRSTIVLLCIYLAGFRVLISPTSQKLESNMESDSVSLPEIRFLHCIPHVVLIVLSFGFALLAGSVLVSSDPRQRMLW